MTQLKDVYGIISFEEKNIKISVFQVEKQSKHCLYFRNIFLNDTINSHLKLNRERLLAYLRQELIKVETVIGVNVIRYLILVPHLNMTINSKSSDEITYTNKNDLESYITNLPTSEEFVCLNRSITEYVVNEQVLTTAPIDGSLKVNYIEYLARKNDVKDFVELINALNIEPLGFYNNPIAYKNSILDHNEKTRMLIDMLEESTNIYFYDKKTDLYRTATIDQGKNWFVNKVSEKIKLSKEDTLNILESFRNIKHISQNVVVCNYHNDHYKSLQQLDTAYLKTMISNLIGEYFQLVVKGCEKVNADSIHFNCDDALFECFDFKLNGNDPVTINRVKVETQQQNIIGLEDENVSNVIWILNGAINEKEILGKEVPCSIDPYFDEGQQEKQFSKNVFMKFGIFLTNVVAKLGGTDDSLWKKS